MSDALLQVAALEKTFHVGFFRKRVEAVRGVDFEVRRGEIFGLLGPNGAGKTTTLKCVLGLVFPLRGTITLFGDTRRSPETMAKIGYLPENPYVYQYLRPLEFLDLCGRLVGMKSEARREKSEALLERVGLGHAAERPIGKFSKGMMQRIGIAQALLHEPPLLVLDEPMSGLDPIGRKEIRDLILEQRGRGTTILFTSHILSDVERLCDRVGIMGAGRMRHYGTVADLLSAEDGRREVILEGGDDALAAALEELGATTQTLGQSLQVSLVGDPSAVLRAALDHGAQVASLSQPRATLEDLFTATADASRASASRPAASEAEE